MFLSIVLSGKVWCEITNKLVKTFDEQVYEAELCDHVILADKIQNAFNVTCMSMFLFSTFFCEEGVGG